MKTSNTRLVPCETSGPLKTLLDNLSGTEGELWLMALKRMLRKESPFVRNWSTWKTIQTSIYSSFQMVYDKLNAINALWYVRGCNEAKVSETINLVVVTVEELGFSHGADLNSIYKQAELLGLSLCSDDLPYQLRLNYLDQPKGESLNIAIEPFIGGIWKKTCILSLSYNEQLSIGLTECTNRGVDGSMFRPFQKFVFCLRK